MLVGWPSDNEREPLFEEHFCANCIVNWSIVLHELQTNTPEEKNTFLNQKALAEGFELVRKEAITKAYIILKCTFLSKYGKKK